MLIDSYRVDMESASSFVQKNDTSVSSTLLTQELKGSEINGITSLSNIQTDYSKSIVFNAEENMSIKDRMQKLLIEMLLGKFEGKKNKYDLYPFSNKEKNSNYFFNPNYTQNMNVNKFAASFETTETYYQKSSVYFSSSAQIKTSEGSFNINLNLSFTQEFYEQHKAKIEIASVNLQDPLIINYDNQGNSFDTIDDEMTFEFDLNNDGSKDDVPLLNKGSGFLALDKNENGTIDDGSELFGTKTGDGFEELAQYDEDGNNWIDEADSIFNSLKIWEINEDGDASLITLSEAGVGAIYLSSIGSGFNYSKGYDEQTARLKESSIFLKENGEAGIVTSVDLVV